MKRKSVRIQALRDVVPHTARADPSMQQHNVPGSAARSLDAELNACVSDERYQMFQPYVKSGLARCASETMRPTRPAPVTSSSETLSLVINDPKRKYFAIGLSA